MDTGNRLSDAIVFATRAHAGQVDKDGNPYILHPLRVMQRVYGEDYQIAAVLHGVIEDCGVDPAVIADRFGPDVRDAVLVLTRQPGEPYADYVARCGRNAIARAVKRADLHDNMDLSRLGREPTRADFKRNKKYVAAKGILAAARASQVKS